MRARRRILPVFVPHLGCPQCCVFCNQVKISGEEKPPRAEELERFFRERLAALPAEEPFEIAFYGGSFTAVSPEIQEAYLSAAAPFLGSRGSIRLSTRPDAIDDVTLDRLERCGVTTVELGAQSMDDRVLTLSRRGHCAEDTIRAAKLVKERGFRLILQMMTGLPGDTPETALQTGRKLAALKPDGVRIYPTVILRDTELEGMWRRGEYREHTPEEAARWCAQLLDLFEEAGIPVIRLGLNPTEELSGGEAVGGAYHPAMGELARSARYYDRACRLLETAAHGPDVVLGVAPGQTSAMTGQHRRNLRLLKEKFQLRSLSVRETELTTGKVILL